MGETSFLFKPKPRFETKPQVCLVRNANATLSATLTQRTIGTVQLTMIPFLFFLVVSCHGADRLVEFSFRTFPRLNQLSPASIPTILRPFQKGSALHSWTLNVTLRPDCNPMLCLSVVNAPNVNSGVALQACANNSYPYQQWEWNASAHTFHLISVPTLCLSGEPVGTVDTLTLQPCLRGGGIKWVFQPNISSTLIAASGKGLFADSVHPSIRSLVDRLTPIFAGSGSDSNAALIGCLGWLVDLCVAFTGNMCTPLRVAP